MNNSLSRRVPQLREPRPALQLLASTTLVFLLAFGVDVLLQWAVGLFVASIVEQDTFFNSAVRQQDAFAENIPAVIKLVSFVALGVGFVATLAFFFTLFSGRSRSPRAFQSGVKPLLKAALLSLRGIATVTFMFLVVIAIYELLLRMVGNQPPFSSLQRLSQHRCTSSSWPIASLIMQKNSEDCIRSSSKKEEHTPWREKSKMIMKAEA
jgi:hypothetical protein